MPRALRPVSIAALAIGATLLFGACNPNFLLGSYNGANNPGGAQGFAQETGTQAQVYSDYASSVSECNGGDQVPVAPHSLPSGEQLELSIPLPGFRLGINGQQLLAQNAANPASLEACMTALAQNLVNDGYSNAIIRPMWEPDSGIYSNDDLTSADNYSRVFGDFATSMRSVAGQSFTFAWYWGANFDFTTNFHAWAGSGVDTVSFDQYDQSWYGGCGVAYDGSSWTATQSQCIWDNDISHNLQNLASFANTQSKPVSIGEWGVINRSDGHGGGDDPTFVNNFTSWMKASPVRAGVSWESYFNFNSGGDSVLSDFPNSLQAFKADL